MPKEEGLNTLIFLGSSQSSDSSSNISSIVITGDTRYIPTGMDVDSFMTMYTMLMLGREYIEKTASDYELISSNSSYQIFKIYDSFMDTNYLVFPGHGTISKIGIERLFNEDLNELDNLKFWSADRSNTV